MLTIYIVRHGQTIYNIQHLLQGWSDSPLTEQGIQHAKNVGQNLSHIPFIACYCSDSQRAIDTANYIINERNIPLFSTSKLKELCFGSFEKGSYDEYNKLGDDPLQIGFVAYGGENLEILRNRLQDILTEITTNHKDGNVLIVSHGRAIMTLLNMMDSSIENTSSSNSTTKLVENCSVTTVEVQDNHFTVRTYSDTSYRDSSL